MGPGTLSGFRKPAQTGTKGETGLAVRGGHGLPHGGLIYSIAFLKNKLQPREPWGQPAVQPADAVIERSPRHQPACSTLPLTAAGTCQAPPLSISVPAFAHLSTGTAYASEG